jgi:hypothetical protein
MFDGPALAVLASSVNLIPESPSIIPIANLQQDPNPFISPAYTEASPFTSDQVGTVDPRLIRPNSETPQSPYRKDTDDEEKERIVGRRRQVYVSLRPLSMEKKKKSLKVSKNLYNLKYFY